VPCIFLYFCGCCIFLQFDAFHARWCTVESMEVTTMKREILSCKSESRVHPWGYLH
jgi:hypothetical protein